MKIYDLGPYRLDVPNKTLTKSGAPVALGLHAIGVLASLIEHAPGVASKARIIEAVWPNVVVEEGNLATQIYAIRRVLAQVPGGDRWIETLSGRGYRYVGPIAERSSVQPLDGPKRSNLPEPPTTFIGRDRELVELKRLLTAKRLVTIQGMGGIGKTRLALQVAAEVVDAYRDGVWIAELASIRDPSLVVTTVGQLLGVTGKASAASISTYLKSRQLFLLLDNCEQVVGACADLADRVLRETHDITIVATSREPLGISGEQSYPLQPLSLPSAETPDAVQRSEAVQLFVERVQERLPSFALTPDRISAVAGICVHLDGIPLALELAAARARSLSVEQINARLGDRFRLLTGGSRAAQPRQQTLRATLDWSYDLLGESERTVLRRLSIFPGTFTVEAASAVASDERIDEHAVLDVISQLVARSLVIADTTKSGTRYRLLETTRTYGLEKLDEADEHGTFCSRHAAFFHDMFDRELDDWLHKPDPEWRSTYLPELANVRAALDWALNRRGDPAIGVELAGASGALWATLGLFDEGVQRLRLAIERIGPETPELAQARLWFWLGRCLTETSPETRALERAVALYRRLDHRVGLGLALIRLARVLALMGQFNEAETKAAEARPLLESCGTRALCYYHSNAGFVKSRMQDNVAARAHYELALECARELRDDLYLLATMGNLAMQKFGLGDLDGALESTRELVALIRTSPAGTRRLLGYGLMNLAGFLLEKNDISASLGSAREGLPLLVADGTAWSYSDYGALVAEREGKFAKAALLAGYSDQAYVAHGAKRSGFTAPLRERLRAALVEKLPAAELERLLAEGAKLKEEEACRLALEE